MQGGSCDRPAYLCRVAGWRVGDRVVAVCRMPDGCRQAHHFTANIISNIVIIINKYYNNSSYDIPLGQRGLNNAA